MTKKRVNEHKFVSFFLRMGLSIVFLYAGIGAFLNPTSWVGFIPIWLRDLISPEIFLPIHAIMDMITGLWLMSGWKKFYAALFTSSELFFIVIFNIGALDIIFRDVALLFSAISLIILHFKEVDLK